MTYCELLGHVKGQNAKSRVKGHGEKGKAICDSPFMNNYNYNLNWQPFKDTHT